MTGCVGLAILFSIIFGKYLAGIGYFGYYAFPAQLPCFVIGILCYRLRSAVHTRPTTSVQGAIACLLAMMFLGFARLIGAPLGGHVAVSLLFGIALLTLWVSNNSGILGLMQWLGRMSYALFLSHILILKIAYSTFFMNGYDLPLLPALVINLALSVIVSAFFSWLLFDPFDRHCVMAVSRWLSKRRKKRLAVEMA